MKVAIIGGGNMGSAFARSFLRGGLIEPAALSVFEHNPETGRALESELGLKSHSAPNPQLSRHDIVVLAVKPQDIAATLGQFKGVISPEQTILSVVTGATLAWLSGELGGHKNIVRSMPNTPAQIGQGMTVYIPSPGMSAEQLSPVEKLLRTTGTILKIEREELMDAATAVSGTGPAYLFYFIEHFMAAAQELGFSAGEAQLLVEKSWLGALELWRASAEDPASLRAKVTSKGGTTAAAISVFETAELGGTFRQGIKAACDRAGELSKKRPD